MNSLSPIKGATAIIQARMASTRLPGKILLEINGRPMLLRMIDRVRRAKTLKNVVIATSDERQDDAVAKLCDREGIACFRGSQNDVLKRFFLAAEASNADPIVRLTGDCPLMDPAVIDQLMQIYLKAGRENHYVTNVLKPTFPDGLDVSVFSFSMLKQAHEEATLLSEREHVVPWMWKQSDWENQTDPRFHATNVELDSDLSALRWTVDEPQDFDFVLKIFQKLLPTNPEFGYRDVLKLIETEPSLAEMNAGIIRDEGYLKSLAADLQNKN